MNVVGSSSKAPFGNAKEEGIPKKYEAHKSIQLYDEAPVVEMSLDQFEIYALKRLKVRCCLAG